MKKEIRMDNLISTSIVAIMLLTATVAALHYSGAGAMSAGPEQYPHISVSASVLCLFTAAVMYADRPAQLWLAGAQAGLAAVLTICWAFNLPIPILGMSDMSSYLMYDYPSKGELAAFLAFTFSILFRSRLLAIMTAGLGVAALAGHIFGIPAFYSEDMLMSGYGTSVYMSMVIVMMAAWLMRNYFRKDDFQKIIPNLRNLLVWIYSRLSTNELKE